MVTPAEIFRISTDGQFTEIALGVFRFQAGNCLPYREYLSLIGCDPTMVSTLGEIPFLPIELFKTHKVYCGVSEPEIVFTSSSTTGQIPSRHYVADLAVYEESFTRGFEMFYGNPRDMAIFALLPGYLEREGSSLIYMFDKLVADAADGGFYLHEYEKLLQDMAAFEGPKLLIGVSYALWEMAEKYPGRLDNTIIMETGGMKGHREEIPKEGFHKILCDAFGVGAIHSEYGMAELLSQAYSDGDGLFTTPPWMKVVCRDVHDPFEILPHGRRGGINVIDLGNLYSCSFIQTQDIGTVYADGRFSIGGRIGGSDIRGCNLLVQ